MTARTRNSAGDRGARRSAVLEGIHHEVDDNLPQLQMVARKPQQFGGSLSSTRSSPTSTVRAAASIAGCRAKSSGWSVRQPRSMREKSSVSSRRERSCSEHPEGCARAIVPAEAGRLVQHGTDSQDAVDRVANLVAHAGKELLLGRVGPRKACVRSATSSSSGGRAGEAAGAEANRRRSEPEEQRGKKAEAPRTKKPRMLADIGEHVRPRPTPAPKIDGDRPGTPRQPRRLDTERPSLLPGAIGQDAPADLPGRQRISPAPSQDQGVLQPRKGPAPVRPAKERARPADRSQTPPPDREAPPQSDGRQPGQQGAPANCRRWQTGRTASRGAPEAGATPRCRVRP